MSTCSQLFFPFVESAAAAPPGSSGSPPAIKPALAAFTREVAAGEKSYSPIPPSPFEFAGMVRGRFPEVDEEEIKRVVQRYRILRGLDLPTART